MVFIPITHYSQGLPANNLILCCRLWSLCCGVGRVAAGRSVAGNILCFLANRRQTRQRPECEGTHGGMADPSGIPGYSTPFAMADRRIVPMSNGQVHIAPRTHT